jgi:murein DD-endopeptidase MepM/ murein hydrolase activator NlpD
MARRTRAAFSLLRAPLLLGLAGLLAWPGPALAAASAPGKPAPNALTPSRRPRAKTRDATLGAVLARPHAALPGGILGRTEPSRRLPMPEHQALEHSLQEEIAPAAALGASPRPSETPFIWPVVGRLNSPFGPRRARFHTGIDIGARQADPVAAAADGRVLYARASRGPLGKTVVLEHADGLRTVYAHLSRLGAREGATVRQGDRIGAVGRTGRATGPHLHFEVRHHGTPVPPQVFLPGAPDELARGLAVPVPGLSPVHVRTPDPASAAFPGLPAPAAGSPS